MLTKNNSSNGKAYGYFLFLMLLAYLLLLLLPACSEKRVENNRKADTIQPNIVLILADDLGLTDISAYGNTIVKTANIDAIASEGVLFTQGYATAPICGPSRAGLITGRYQQRFGQEFQIQGKIKDPTAARIIPDGYIQAYLPEAVDSTIRQGLPTNEITLAQLLKSSGYKTGIVGKWHLGSLDEFVPQKRGFDTHFGFLGGASPFADTANPEVVTRMLPWVDHYAAGLNRNEERTIWDNGKTIEVREYLTQRFADEAVKFIEENKDTSFFLYLPFNAPHTPTQAPKHHYEKYAHVQDLNKRTYYAQISALDEAVGAVTKKLKDLQLEDNTLIIFLSDNGGASYTRLTENTPLKGGKLTQYEGGINVPYILKWKAQLPAGKTYNYPVSHLDIFSTAAAVAGAKLPTDRKFDGVNLIPFANGKDTSRPHEALFWRAGFQKAIRKGDWKLLVDARDNAIELYNLAVDKNEKNNLSSSHPDTVKLLQQAIYQWESELTTPLWKSWRTGRVKIQGGKTYNLPL